MGKVQTAKWNDEEWIIRNIPANARLSIELFYKDDTQISDQCLDKFEIEDMISYRSPQTGQYGGKFHLSIRMKKSSEENGSIPQYTFDGPCRFFNYNFFTAAGPLSLWEIQLRRIPSFFHANRCPSTRDLFTNRPYLFDAKKAMKKAHDVCNGCLKNADDLWSLIFKDRTTNLVQPRVYNYIIDDHSWQFSETGHQFFGSRTNKHALLANCSDSIRFAGEFHPRPKRGWHRWNDSEWELVFDNASGTYSPDPTLLNNLKELLSFNFPELNILTYDYRSPLLQQSVEQLEIAAKSNRYKKNQMG